MSEKTISAVKLLDIPPEKITFVDVREKDDVLIHPLGNAVNIPFSQLSKQIDSIPKDKPVYVICSVGDLSEDVVEILTDRGYDAYSIDGGFKAYERAVRSKPVRIDAKGLKCPGPIVKVADEIRPLAVGQRIIAEATEEAFTSDIAVWCERTGNKLVKLDTANGIITAEIEKADAPAAKTAAVQNDKTFIVFSGDLDKTIAAFIIANGAVSMGRKVTMFFTFWGLNILRRPKKVKVAKNFIEKMFGAMMPRGTKKLGLSRMNMGGAGAKMIRGIMKQKGVSSLEELIQNAIDHGVRIVACQMSMDIMGIKQEEFMDGVELGGVATFLGSAETSDTSMFI